MNDASAMRRECQRLMDEGRAVKGEYQLHRRARRAPQAGQRLQDRRGDGLARLRHHPALLETTQDIVAREPTTDAAGTNSVFIQPVYIGPGATVTDSVVGPHASIEAGAVIAGSTVARSIVFANGQVEASTLDGALVGQKALVRGFSGALNVGDHATVGVAR